MKVGIIGGGASGMAAALSAAENPCAEVTVLERQARVGRKLLATGNGRCNLSNIHTSADAFHGKDPSFVSGAFSHFSSDDTLQWFSKLGLCTVTEPSGKVYPFSDQANSVVDILRLNMEQAGVRVITGIEIQKITITENGFQVSGDGRTMEFDRLIIASGGLAGSKLGGTMAGYKLLSKLGHKATKLSPSLVQIRSNWRSLAALKGIRVDCKIQVYHNGCLFKENQGQLQFTEYGISGPVVFEISRDVCAQPGQWSCKLDLIPQWTEEQLYSELLRRSATTLPVSELLTGILHNRLGRVVTQSAGISLQGNCNQLREDVLKALASEVKSLEITLSEPMGMDSAQVTAGGVMTDQFDPNTMESRLVPGLYACGEVLDIDGDCGGFNLQWAWSSGRTAGAYAGGVLL